MPTSIPIIGGEFAGLVQKQYVAHQAVNISSNNISKALQAVDVTADGSYKALQALDVSKDVSYRFASSTNIVSLAHQSVVSALNIIAGDSFTILADLLQEELDPDVIAQQGAYGINGRLTINGQEVPIKSFDYQVPSGRLGSILNVTLTNPISTNVPANGVSVKFELVFIINGSEIPVTLMDNGKIEEREYSINYIQSGPNDSITISSLDVMADKFTLGPRRPVVMFDPVRVKYYEVSTETEDLIRDELGRPIKPVIEPVVGLTMKQILDRAFTSSGGGTFISTLTPGFISSNSRWIDLLFTQSVDQTGIGFDRVITNIQNYPVRRADFTIEGGWKNGAGPVVDMYSPIYFVRGNDLYIIDADQPLPYGVTPMELPLSSHKLLSQKKSFKPDTNAVLLTYQYSGNDPSEEPRRVSRDVFNQLPDDVFGELGTPEYVRIETDIWVREFYMEDNPTEVLASYELRKTVRTHKAVVWDIDGEQVLFNEARLVHTETTEHTYEGELNLGYTKSIQAAVLVPTDVVTITLLEVEQETKQIIWKDDPYNPGVNIQDRVLTDRYGRCIKATDTETITDDGQEIVVQRLYPILRANEAGLIEPNVEITEMILMSTTRETLAKIKGNQHNVEIVTVDYLNNTITRSQTDPRTGNTSTDPYEMKSRTKLFRDTDSEAEIGYRIPTTVNAYELPRDRAEELARRVLRRLKDPLMTMPIQLPSVNMFIERGTVVKGQTRDGYTTNHVITGYSISGQNLGKQGHRISQNAESIELLTPIGTLILS